MIKMKINRIQRLYYTIQTACINLKYIIKSENKK